MIRPGSILVPTLIGVCLAGYVPATIAMFRALLTPLETLAPLVILAVAGGVIAGLRLPNHYARLFNRRYRRADHFILLTRDGEALTANQYRLTASSCLILAGLGMALLIPLVVSLAALHQRALQLFHWTLLTAHLLDLLMIGMYSALPMTLIGVALHCGLRLAVLPGHHPMGFVAGLGAGLAGGLILTRYFSFLPANATLLAALVLFTAGVCLLRFSVPAPPAVGNDPGIPSLSIRWRTILVRVPALAGLLLICYLQAWTEHPAARWTWACRPLAIGLLTVCLLLPAGPLSRRTGPLHHIALLCMLLSILTTAAVIQGGRELPGAAAGAVDVVLWIVVLAPVAVTGRVLRATLLTLADCWETPAGGLIRGLVSVGLGIVAACAVLVGLPHVPAQVVLVIIALMWLLMGGLVLIHEPHFNYTRRRRSVAFMLGVLVFCVAALPTHSRRWASANRNSADGVGLVLLHAPALTDVADLATITGLADLQTICPGPDPDDVLSDLRLSKERYANLILKLPMMQDAEMPERTVTALLSAGLAHLHPNGVLLLQFRSDVQVNRWRPYLHCLFEEVLWLPARPGQGAGCLVASNERADFERADSRSRRAAASAGLISTARP